MCHIFEVIVIFLNLDLVISHGCYLGRTLTNPSNFLKFFAMKIINFWLDKIQNSAKIVYLWKSDCGHTTACGVQPKMVTWIFQQSLSFILSDDELADSQIPYIEKGKFKTISDDGNSLHHTDPGRESLTRQPNTNLDLTQKLQQKLDEQTNMAKHPDPRLDLGISTARAFAKLPNIRKLGRPWFFQLGLTMWWTPETSCSMHIKH